MYRNIIFMIDLAFNLVLGASYTQISMVHICSRLDSITSPIIESCSP